MPSIRLIAGKFGGRVLDAPANNNRRTHPMGERIRGAIFNSLGARLEGARVLDAFAGTGALGLESLSRGALSATAIEKDRVAQSIIGENIKRLGVEDSMKLIRATVSKWVDTSESEQFDVIFADPPYYDPQLGSVARLVERLTPGGIMIVSSPESEPGIELAPLKKIDERVYAGARIAYFEHSTYPQD